MKYPSYLQLLETGEFERKEKEALLSLEKCSLCPRKCEVNRLKNEKGICRTGRYAWISSYGPHFGEESPLVGYGGSGTIFFTHCNLKCIFCQNYDISHLGAGHEVTPDELADIMLELQRMGCHNINFVSPSHVVAQVIEALRIAVWKGLTIPVVYNTGGYDSIKALKLMEGIVDIYMPDMKYSSNEVAYKYSGVMNYVEVNRNAVKEMHRQVGDLILNNIGIAIRGLLVRHLILPDGLAGTQEIMKFLSEEISQNTYVNIMNQYRPCYKAGEFPELSRRITHKEWLIAVNIARKYGLTRLNGL